MGIPMCAKNAFSIMSIPLTDRWNSRDGPPPARALTSIRMAPSLSVYMHSTWNAPRYGGDIGCWKHGTWLTCALYQFSALNPKPFNPQTVPGGRG